MNFKRPRIDPEIYKFFAKKAIDNETTTEFEITKALEYMIKNKEVLKNENDDRANRRKGANA